MVLTPTLLTCLLLLPLQCSPLTLPGYFRCNRWAEDEEPGDESKPTDESAQPDTNNAPLTSHAFGTSLHTSRMARKRAKEMARFLHHFSRFTAHKESEYLERKMADTIELRLDLMISAALNECGDISLDLGTSGVTFVHNAFTELLECRSLLQHSYAYAFCRFPPSSRRLTTNRAIEKLSFEHFQSELEMVTEQLSNVVARCHL